MLRTNEALAGTGGAGRNHRIGVSQAYVPKSPEASSVLPGEITKKVRPPTVHSSGIARAGFTEIVKSCPCGGTSTSLSVIRMR